MPSPRSDDETRAEREAVYAGVAFKALQALALRELPAMSAQHVSNTMWALATMRQATTPLMLQCCAHLRKAHLQNATLLDSAQVFWALGELEFVPSVRPRCAPTLVRCFRRRCVMLAALPTFWSKARPERLRMLCSACSNGGLSAGRRRGGR